MKRNGGELQREGAAQMWATAELVRTGKMTYAQAGRRGIDEYELRAHVDEIDRGESTDGYKKLAVEMVSRAIQAMIRKPRPFATTTTGKSLSKLEVHHNQIERDRRVQRVVDTVWLGSSRSTVWFDIAGLEQQAVLGAAGWSDVVGEILANDDPVSSDEAAFLQRATAA